MSNFAPLETRHASPHARRRRARAVPRLATARASTRATARAMSRAPDAPWTTKDVLATLGDAMTRGRVESRRGDADARNAIQRAAIARVCDADRARVPTDAIDALAAGARGARRGDDDGRAMDGAARVLRRRAATIAGERRDGRSRARGRDANERKRGRRVRVAEARMTFVGASKDSTRWRSLNDGVMGGTSDGFMARRGDEGASFMGNVSLERNGGFASVRAMVEEDASDFDGVYVDAKSPTGATKKFLFILKDDECLREQINFKVAFEVGEEYGRVKIPFAAFARPERMGRVCVREPLRLAKLREFGLMILKGEPGQVGRFELVVREIGFYRG